MTTNTAGGVARSFTGEINRLEWVDPNARTTAEMRQRVYRVEKCTSRLKTMLCCLLPFFIIGGLISILFFYHFRVEYNRLSRELAHQQGHWTSCSEIPWPKLFATTAPGLEYIDLLERRSDCEKAGHDVNHETVLVDSVLNALHNVTTYVTPSAYAEAWCGTNCRSFVQRMADNLPVVIGPIVILLLLVLWAIVRSLNSCIEYRKLVRQIELNVATAVSAKQALNDHATTKDHIVDHGNFVSDMLSGWSAEYLAAKKV